MGKRYKYDRWLGDDSYRAHKHPDVPYEEPGQNQVKMNGTSPHIYLDHREDSGVCFGVPPDGSGKYVGMPQGDEGNILVIGGNGSGKSSGIAKPTLITWKGALCVTDLKGELSSKYERFYKAGIVERKCIIFDPLKADIGYDPFSFIRKDDPLNLVSNMRQIVFALHPLFLNDPQPFWRSSEQELLMSYLLYYFDLGLAFSETMLMIVYSTAKESIQEILTSSNEEAKAILGPMANMEDKNLANIDRGLRNSLTPFSTDPYINDALDIGSGRKKYFTWDDLNDYNIFLKIPANRIEQWGPIINLMYTQLFQFLERRPEKYTSEGQSNIPVLLMLDEFPRFGKLETITNALCTLRSKSVNICLMVQSIAQLDKLYGEYDRRIIFDNCQYQIILRANDVETQKYISESIGVEKRKSRSFGESWDEDMNVINYSRQATDSLEYKVFPHELSTITDVLLLTPYGFHRIKKIQGGSNASCAIRSVSQIELVATSVTAADANAKNTIKATSIRVVHPKSEPLNSKIGGRKMEPITEKVTRTKDKVKNVKRQKRIEVRNEHELQKKKDQRRNYILGELVTKYFPEVLGIDPGNNDENSINFKPVEMFLSVLSSDTELVNSLKAKSEKNEISSN